MGISNVSVCGMNRSTLLYCAACVRCVEFMNTINAVPFRLYETEVGFSPQETFYKHVIGDVCKNMREAFMNEGVDEQVLTELKEVNTPFRYFRMWGNLGRQVV